MTDTSKKLTDKQQVFVEEYLRCWNASEAARRAGYSEKTARQIGEQNLSKLDIQEKIQARIAELKMSADEVLSRLGEQARGDIGDFIAVTKSGQPRLCLKRARRRKIFAKMRQRVLKRF
jgi:phage terminase small subunit